MGDLRVGNVLNTKAFRIQFHRLNFMAGIVQDGKSLKPSFQDWEILEKIVTPVFATPKLGRMEGIPRVEGKLLRSTAPLDVELVVFGNSSTLRSRRDTSSKRRGRRCQRRNASRLARCVSSAPALPAK